MAPFLLPYLESLLHLGNQAAEPVGLLAFQFGMATLGADGEPGVAFDQHIGLRDHSFVPATLGAAQCGGGHGEWHRGSL